MQILFIVIFLNLLNYSNFTNLNDDEQIYHLCLEKAKERYDSYNYLYLSNFYPNDLIHTSFYHDLIKKVKKLDKRFDEIYYKLNSQHRINMIFQNKLLMIDSLEAEDFFKENFIEFALAPRRMDIIFLSEIGYCKDKKEAVVNVVTYVQSRDAVYICFLKKVGRKWRVTNYYSAR